VITLFFWEKLYFIFRGLMLKKSSEEVEINPNRHARNEEETVYHIEFSMNEIHSISEEQRKEILEVLLAGSRKQDDEDAEEEIVDQEIGWSSNPEEGFRGLIILAVGIFLGAFFVFLLSMM